MNNLRELINEHRVVDLGPLPAPRLAPTASLQQALPFLVRGRRGAIVAVEGDRPVGILSERDVLERLPEGQLGDPEARRRTRLAEVMTQPPVAIPRQASLAEAVAVMVRGGYRHLVVIDRHGGLCGLLTSNDIVQHLTDQFPEETLNLPPRLRQQYRSPEGA
jgi:CBS domain-containing protein